MQTDSITQRYHRAVRLTGPKLAAVTAGIAAEGYWLSDSMFFFCAERLEPLLGSILTVPMLADATTGTVEEVVSPGLLAKSLSDYSSQPIELEALGDAGFDMPNLQTLAVSLGGTTFLVDPRARRVVQSRQAFEARSLYSPDGRYACFTREHNVWLREPSTGLERALTVDGVAHYGYARQPDTFSQSPIPVGLWSPNSRWFLTHRLDERSLPEAALVQHSPPGGGRPTLHHFKYPLPGDPLPVATYVAIHADSGRTVTFPELPVEVAVASPFLLRTAWFVGEDEVWLVRFDRYYKRVELVCLDLARGTSRRVLSESTQTGYLELNQQVIGTPNVRTLAGSNEVIWFSERDGWGHLYLYDASTGALKNRITEGEWLVRDIVHVDEQHRRVFFLASGTDPNVDPARRVLCSVNLDGTDFRTLLAHSGDIFVPPTEPCGLDQSRPFQAVYAPAGVSPNCRFAVVREASVITGNVTRIVDLHTLRGFIVAAATPAHDELPARHFTAHAADGVTRLHGVMFLPTDFDENRQYPLIDYIYPGPQVTHQPQSFRSPNAAPAMSLAELGFITIMFDTRGVPTRSRALRQAGYGELLEPQLADHAAVVQELCGQHAFIDANRIGMIGYSAGGAATARALFDYAQTFKVGVAVCGSHDASGLSAFMSDKFRGPGPRKEWLAQANAAAAYKLRGALLLMSSDMDQNVHVSNTLVLVDVLIKDNKEFDLVIVPNEGHDMLLTSGYVQRRVWDYFVRHLLGEAPPRDFVIEIKPPELARFGRNAWREQCQQ